MSFAGARDVMTVMEDLIRKIWAKERGLSGPRLTYPFAKMPYDLAMTTFGTDKPDLRFSHSRVGCTSILSSRMLMFVLRFVTSPLSYLISKMATLTS